MRMFNMFLMITLVLSSTSEVKSMVELGTGLKHLVFFCLYAQNALQQSLSVN